MTSEKITPDHLSRKALVYVRQSTAEQVRTHRESQRRQYDLADKARVMGWRQVDVIDDDLGHSGTTTAGRTGFARLVTAVCLREVGAVFSLEASRLARNNRDWYQLLDLCAVVGTLIVDFDGIYDPRLLNDRLLLGLKGTMSEFELGLIRQRGHEALRQMAQRGELITTVPVGYRRSEDGRCEKDPDQRIQHAIQSVFQAFAQCGSVRQTLLWFRQDGLVLPAVVYGPQGPKVIWRPPVYNTIHKVLTNPTYAGAYAFGRTETRTRVINDETVKTRGHRRDAAAWDVLILDHHEGYIDWATYQRNQQQIRENANMKGALTRGPARGGQSLLAGLLRCARCGRKFFVSSSGNQGKVPRYACRGAAVNHGTGKCISFGGLAVDAAVERELLRVVAPAAVEASLAALSELEGQRDERRLALELTLRQAQYEADRARRQYNAVEPEHRLVAAELERRWNHTLTEVQRLEDELRQFATPTPAISVEERMALLTLGEDLQALWTDPATDMRLKKRLVRTVIREIIANVDEERAAVDLVIHWTGGCHTALRVRKNRTGQHRFRTALEIVDLVRDLAQVSPDRDIASVLNRLGVKTGKENTWTEVRIRSLRSAHGIRAYSPEAKETAQWVTMREAGARLGISPMSVRRLIARGIIAARQIVPHAPWLIQTAALDTVEARRAVAAIKEGRRSPLPEDPNQRKLDLTRV
jgi:DNA invertase Pin-like site-specific DNA recombinase